jgi:hypothetical protein
MIGDMIGKGDPVAVALAATLVGALVVHRYLTNKEYINSKISECVRSFRQYLRRERLLKEESSIANCYGLRTFSRF